MKLKKKQALEYYQTMRKIREFEETLHRQNTTGEVPGMLHLSSGGEAHAVGVCAHLTDSDYIASHHRGHGHCIAKGSDPLPMMMEIFGKEAGLCRGRGGSMHLAEIEKGSLGANGIVGAGGPLATGAALGQKMRGTRDVTICFHGDGSTNEGYMFEALNMAVIWKLPVVFYCENNGYGENTGIEYVLGANSIAERAGAFGMPSVQIDGTDFFEVYRVAGEAIKHCRAGKGPYYIEAAAPRFHGHYEGDAQLYRTKDELASIRETCCLTRYRQALIADNLATEAELDVIDSDVEAEIVDTLQKVQQSAWPSPDELCEDIYINY